MKPRNFHVRVALGTVAFIVSLLWPGATSANSLTTSVIGLFPRQMSDFAYADMKTGRKSPWFTQVQEQLVPDKLRQFQQFLTSAGMDLNSQVDELCWGTVDLTDGHGQQFIGVALGQFDVTTITDMLTQKNLPVIEVHGFDLYAFGNGSGPSDIFFTFIDSNTAAFGQRVALDKLIDARTGAAESLLSNDKMFSLITEANGGGLIWAVLDHGYARMAMEKMFPQAAQFRQSDSIINQMKGIAINVDAGDDVNVELQAICNSTEDANIFGAAMQASLLYRRYQASQGSEANSVLTAALDQARVTPSGDRLRVDFSVTQDQILSLLLSHN